MATALEQFVNSVRTLSAQGNFRELCEFLNKSSEVLSKNIVHLDNVLETLNMQQHSLGILAVLCIKLSAVTVGQEFEVVFTQVQEFITGCNGEQIRFAPDTFADLCHLLTQHLVERKMAILGIDVLAKAIRKIRLNEAQLTSIHSDLYQLCLVACCMKPALEFLDVDIVDISQEGGHFDSKYFLSYYYYGGMIYTALKKYDRALYFFEVAITTPASAVSHIMLEAYKKYIMVSLVLYGRVQSIPKYTSQIVGRFFKTLSQPYLDIATAYASNSPEQVHAAINKHQESLNRDKMVGLAKQVLASIYRKNIQRLTKTFLTLSLADMANRVQLPGPREAEIYVLNMIEDGEIYATINQKDGMVIFHDNPEKYNCPNMLHKLEEEMAICTELARKVQTMEEDITINPLYVKKSSCTQDEDLSGPSTSVTSSKIPTYTM